MKTFMAANAGTVRRILDFLSFMVSGFAAGLVEERPDVVAATSPPLFAAVAGLGVGACRGVPFVMELSDLWPESIAAVGAMKKGLALRGVEKLELFLYRRADRVVALTAAFRENLAGRGIPAGKIDVVRNGVDLSRYSPRVKDAGLAARAGIGDGEFVVGYIGTQGMAHGLENVLDAAAEVGNARFLLVGTGSEHERLVREAGKRGLRNVTFVPAQPKEAVPGWWSLCDVALVHLRNAPLFRTVIPSKIFEAMGMGLPVLLACPEGEASRIVEQEGIGLAVPAGDPKALSQAILLLAETPALRDQFAEKSRLAAARYTRERQAREMLAAIEVAAGVAHAALQPLHG